MITSNIFSGIRACKVLYYTKFFQSMRRQRLADATSEFVGKRHSLTLRQTPRWAQSLIVLFLFFGGSALAASFIIEIEEVITVSGSLRPAGGSRSLLAPVTATVDRVNVEEGDFVNEGDVLAVYDTRDAAIRKVNILAQIDLSSKSLKQNLDLKETELQALKRNLEFTKDIYDRYEDLNEAGATSELTLLSQSKQIEDITSQILRLNQQKSALQLQFDQRIKGFKTELSQIQLLLENSELVAPVNGTIFELSVSPKQVVTLGSPILEIIPNNVAKANVFVSNRDIGFVTLGQDSQVRVDAYPFTKFGDIDGKVTSIGADALEPDSTNSSYRFPVTITLLNKTLIHQGRQLPLKPGMSVQANLKLREKKVISLLTDLFTRNIDGLKSLRD